MSPVQKPAPAATLSDWLRYLESIHATAIDMGLERVREVADRLGLALSGVKFVVGGTNGKGSTCAMLEAILLAAGYKVGLHLAPSHRFQRARPRQRPDRHRRGADRAVPGG